MKLRRKHKQESEIFTDTLVDILFIVLMFFLIISTAANPNIVPVHNPKGTKESTAKQNIMVSVNKNQEFYIGTTKVPNNNFDSLLRKEILRYKSWVDTPTVVINADTAAFYGEVFRIMRVAKKDNARVVARVEH